jgi:hypothetical protein
MYSTGGHQLVVNEYHNECLRKARETEATRDAEHARTSDRSTVAAPAPEETALPILQPA